MKQTLRTYDDNFVIGWLLCLSSLIGRHGVSTDTEELFIEIGSPSAAEVRRLMLSTYDRININAVRKAER